MGWEDFIIGAAVNTVLQVVKTSSGKAKYRRALLKIFTAIATAFESDAEFQKVRVTGDK